MPPKIKIANQGWKKDPCTEKQVEYIEKLEESIGLDRRRTMQIANQPGSQLTSLTKGEASELIDELEDLYGSR